MKITAEIEAVPKARPRITANGTFLPKRNRQFREALQQILKAAMKGSPPMETALRVSLHFFKPCKTTSRRFGDLDNLAKAVLDAANGIIFADDSQIIALEVLKFEGSGRIEMEVMKIETEK